MTVDLDPWADDDDTSEPHPPPDDAAHANSMLRRMRTLAARRAEISAITQGELDRIAQRACDLDRPLRESYEWLERAVAAWGGAVNRDDPSRKTIQLPHGEVAIRVRQQRIEASTDQRLIGELAAYRPGFVTITSRLGVDKAEVKRGVKVGDVVAVRDGEEVRQALVADTDPETGEVIVSVLPGVHVVVPTAPRVTVTVEP